MIDPEDPSADEIEGVNDGPVHVVSFEWLQMHCPVDCLADLSNVYRDEGGNVKLSHTLYVRLADAD